MILRCQIKVVENPNDSSDDNEEISCEDADSEESNFLTPILLDHWKVISKLSLLEHIIKTYESILVFIHSLVLE
jgi:hypothetical protein